MFVVTDDMLLFANGSQVSLHLVLSVVAIG